MTDRIETEAPTAQPAVYYACDICTGSGNSESNCYPANLIRRAPSSEWCCEYCYEELETDDPQSYPAWADLPRALDLSEALVALATEAQESRDRIEQLERDLVAEKARIDPLQIATNCLARAAEIFNSDGKFVGNVHGDCPCSFITGKDVMDAKKAKDAA